MYGVTKQQQRALEFIERATRASGGICPTRREIAEGIGLSLGAASKLVSQLIQRGRLRSLPEKARALEVIRPEARHPAPSEVSAAREMLVRHYRACGVSDTRIVGLTDLAPDFVGDVHGEKLLTETVLAALRAQPGVP